MIRYHTQDVPMPAIDPQRVSQWIDAVAASHGRRLGEVNYIFMDDPGILAVNRQFLGHDYYTDIITFDYTEGDILSGDLFISLDTVGSNAELVGATMSDAEQCQIASSPNPAQAFMRLWTMKESLLKLTGEGISDDLHHLLECTGHNPPAYEFDTRVYPRFVCTVCADYFLGQLQWIYQ